MKQRIAILGGGMSALTAAFEITSKPGWKDQYELDVYQLGWRLGGKGASGRNPKANMRIEEHGLHIFLGFYDNAFRVMRACYQELGRGPDAPLGTWDQAFKPHNFVVYQDKVGDRWQPWPMDFPTNNSTPGDGGGLLPTPWDYLEMLVGWIKELIGEALLPGLSSEELEKVEDHAAAHAPEIFGDVANRRGTESAKNHPVLAHARAAIDAATGGAREIGDGVAQHAVAHVLAGLMKSLDRDATRHDPVRHHGVIAELLGVIRAAVDRTVGHLLDDDPKLRHLFILVDMAASCGIGMIADDLLIPPVYWFKIDDQDFRVWIQKHGAAKITAWSGPIGAAYALAFGEKTQIGAGTALHGIFRLNFTYKGSIFWEMQAGMGDTIFAPLYLVLKQRGVRFHFFHRVDNLELSADKKTVAKVHMGRQIDVKDGAEYQPLVPVKDLPCWPSYPDYAQLVGGDELETSGCDLEDWWTPWKDTGKPLVLEHGRDYDTVILGTAIGSYGYIAKELIAANPRFAAMVEAVATTQTQAMQLWFRPDLRGLGWTEPKPIVGNYALWFDTWSDMTHLIPREDWPADATPGNLAYLVSRMLDDEPMPPRSDHGYTARQAARVRKHAIEWLESQVRPLWPSATQTDEPDALNWSFLMDPEDREGIARFDAQYTRGILNPSERYVLSEPNSTHKRLRSDDTGFANLYMSGDHAFTGINAGCIEAATMSGMQVSQAIAGVPEHIVGEILPQYPDHESAPVPGKAGTGGQGDAQ